MKNLLSNRWLPIVLIVAAIFGLYFKTLQFGFVNYDDTHLIVSNHDFLSDPANIIKAFTQDVFSSEFFRSSKSYYRPVLTLSFMLDTWFSGADPFSYHLTNIIYHILASCLMFLLILKLSGRREPAFFFAMVFAVHPVLTQAVAWVPGRNDSLMTVFFLASFIFFMDFIEKRKWRDLLFHIGFFIVALFTKETSLGLIVIGIMYVFLIKKEKPNAAQVVPVVAGWFGSVALWLALRTMAVENPGVTIPHMINSITINSPALVQYAGKILFPANLSVYPVMQDIPLYIGGIAIAIVSLLLFFTREKRLNYVTFGAIWFVLFLIPSLISVRPGAHTLLLEHRVYLPMIGLCIALTETWPPQKLKSGNIIPLIATLIIAGIFSFITFGHSNAMRDPFSYWSNAAVSSPSSAVAHLNLGDYYYSKRDLDKAEREFRKAVELDTFQPMAHNNLGLIYAVRGMLDMAEREFEKELTINPGYEKSLYNLGMINYDRGNFSRAIEYWMKTLEVNPYNIKANSYLAYYYYSSRDFEKTQIHLDRLIKRGVKINPDHFRELKPIR